MYQNADVYYLPFGHHLAMGKTAMGMHGPFLALQRWKNQIRMY